MIRFPSPSSSIWNFDMLCTPALRRWGGIQFSTVEGELIHKVTPGIRTVNRRSEALHCQAYRVCTKPPVQPCSVDQCYMRRL